MSGTKPLSIVISAYSLLVKWASVLQSPFLLLVRLYWGWQFVQTGWGKLHRLGQVADFFSSLNIPAPAFSATFCSGLEFVGGILLILGLGSRLIGLLLTGNMSVAYWTSERDALMHVFSDPGKFYNADPYTFWFASLLVMIFGPGTFSLDYLIGRYLAQQKPALISSDPALSRS